MIKEKLATFIKKDWNRFKVSGGVFRLTLFGFSGIVALFFFQFWLSTLVENGVNLEKTVAYLGAGVAIASLLQCYITMPSRRNLIRAWKSGWLGAVGAVLSIILAMALAILSAFIAYLTF